MRLCYTCKKEKPLVDFYSGNCYKDGYDIYCKQCARNKRVDNKHNPKGNRHKKRLTTDIEFWCPKCKKYKNKAYFYTDSSKRSPSGYDVYCKDCDKQRKLVKNLSSKALKAKKERDTRYAENNRESESKRKLRLYHKLKNTPKWRVTKARKDSKRRSNITNSVNDLTCMDIAELLAIQENKCASCNTKFNKTNRYTIDHIVPVSKGGGLTFNNVQLLCKHCNCSKGAKTILYRKV